MHADRFERGKTGCLAKIEPFGIMGPAPLFGCRIRRNHNRLARGIKDRNVIAAVAHIVETALAELFDQRLALAAAGKVNIRGAVEDRGKRAGMGGNPECHALGGPR